MFELVQRCELAVLFGAATAAAVWSIGLHLETVVLFGAGTAAAVWSGADTIWSSDVNAAAQCQCEICHETYHLRLILSEND